MSELVLYNTLSRQREVFQPEDRETCVSMSVDPPSTTSRIRNARPVVVFDVLFRLLRHLYGPEGPMPAISPTSMTRSSPRQGRAARPSSR